MSPFTNAAVHRRDVVFFVRTRQKQHSDMREIIASISSVQAVDPLTVRIKTDGPDPVLPTKSPTSTSCRAAGR